MANPYESQSASNYNASPPPDDGSQSAANLITWAGIKTKLVDPIKAYVDAVNTAVSDAFGKNFLNSINAQIATYDLQASDRGKIIPLTNAITVNLLPAATADEGFVVTFFNADSTTKTIDGDGSETINGETTFQLTGQHQSATLLCDGSNWKIASDAGNPSAPDAREALGVAMVGGNVLTPHEGLIVKQVTSTTVDINADVLLVRDSDRNAMELSTVDLTVDISDTAGENALDTGTEANSTWYHLWVIAKEDGTVAGLLSTSSTAPTMPTDYTRKGYVGAVYNNSSGNFVAFHQVGNLVAATQAALLSAANGVTASLTSQSLSTTVPTTAKEVALTATINAESTSGDPSLEVASTSGGLGRRFIAGGYSNGTSGSPRGSCDLPLVEAQTMYWIASFTTAWNIDLKVTGWRY